MMAALGVGLAVAVTSWLVRRKNHMGVLLILGSAVISVLALGLLVEGARAFIDADANGWDRIHLWSVFVSD